MPGTTTTEEKHAPARLEAVYLNDHLAGSAGAVALVRRAAREREGTELGAFLSSLAVRIEEDRQALQRVMAAGGARPQKTKLAVAWLAEKGGRLKPNGRLIRGSPLSPLIELEALAVGISGKRLLWRLLREHRPPGSEVVDLDQLIARADSQLEDVERHRLIAGSVLTG